MRRTGEEGSIAPLLAMVVMIIMFFALASLAISEMAAERARQQSSADLAALGAAGQLAKGVEKTRMIDGAIWMRNVTLDALYFAAALATVGSAGAGVEVFAIPLKFQKATIKAVEALETAKTAIAVSSVAASAAAGHRLVRQNGPQDLGGAVPAIQVTAANGPGQRRKDLEKMIETYGRRIEQADSKMKEVLADHERHKSALRADGLTKKEVADHVETKRLLKEVRERSGRVGGLMSQRNRRRNELLKISGRGVANLPDSVIAGVYHPSTPVPFSASLGGIETGDNVAFAGAAVVDAPPENVIGSDALKRALAGTPIAGAAAERLDGLLDTVNIFGETARSQAGNLGPLGGFLSKALDMLGIIPPPLSETRPSLISVEEATGDQVPSEVFRLLEMAGGR